MFTTRRPVRSRPSHARALPARIGIVAVAVTLFAVAAGPAPTLSAHSKPPAPGKWTQLGLALNAQPTLLPQGNGRALVVWTHHIGVKYRYEVAELAQFGGIAVSPKDLFAGKDWGGPSWSPVLVSDGGSPLLIFSGQAGSAAPPAYSLGCIVGELRTSSGWKLQTWSLSRGCTASNVGFGGATVTQKNTLSAAWSGAALSGAAAVDYRLGAASAIPAATADSSAVLSSGHSAMVNEATDSRTGDVYGGWYRFFSKPASQDGVYIADFSKGSPPKKLPGSDTESVGHLVQRLAMASPVGRGGIYAAICRNTSPCGKVELWRYGSKKILGISDSSDAETITLSAGPAGRLWVAWWNSTAGRVFTCERTRPTTLSARSSRTRVRPDALGTEEAPSP